MTWKKTLCTVVIVVALAECTLAQEQESWELARFVKARLVAMTFGQDQSEPILSCQFEVLNEYGYMGPVKQSFLSPMTTITSRIEMPADAVVSL